MSGITRRLSFLSVKVRGQLKIECAPNREYSDDGFAFVVR